MLRIVTLQLVTDRHGPVNAFVAQAGHLHLAYGKLPYTGGVSRSNVARLEARLPAEVSSLLKRAAEIEGRTLTDFVVTAAREAALRTIEANEIVRLSVEDQRILAEALLDPPAPNAALVKAARRRRELLGE